MKTTQGFYLVINSSDEKAQNTIDAICSLERLDTSVHIEHHNGTTSFQVETTDLIVATKIKLLFGCFIQHVDSGDA